MNNTNICPIIYSNQSHLYNKINNSVDYYRKETLYHVKNYLPAAITSVSKRKGIIRYILTNDDLFSNLVTAVMFADYTYDKTKGSINYWRSKNCIWTLNKTFYKNKCRLAHIDDWSQIKITTKETFEKDQYELIAEKIDALNKKNKAIIKLYYQDNLTEAEIAKRFSVSQQRISKILINLKKKLNNG